SPFRFFLRTAHDPSVFLTRSLSYCATQHTSVPDRGLLHSPVRGVAVVWDVNRCCSKGSVCHSRSRFFPHIREPVQLVVRGRPQEGPRVPRGWGPMSEHRVVQFAFGDFRPFRCQVTGCFGQFEVSCVVGGQLGTVQLDSTPLVEGLRSFL